MLAFTCKTFLLASIIIKGWLHLYFCVSHCTCIHALCSMQELQLIADAMKAGKIVATIDSTFALKDVKAAFERLMTGRAKGKVVIKIQ